MPPYHPTIPWVYHHAAPLVYTLHATARWCTLPGERALGSTKEKPVGEARLRVLKSLILLDLLWADAQSCSISRVNKVERLDRRRYYLPLNPYVTVMLRIVASLSPIRSLKNTRRVLSAVFGRM